VANWASPVVIRIVLLLVLRCYMSSAFPPIYEKFVTDTNKGGELRTRTPFSTT
jgi:hypothetical protein